MTRMNGMKRSPTYNSWSNMIQRCRNPKATDYEHYGGKGISVCDSWLLFDNFISDMGERPDKHTLDRKDSEKGYAPGNCRWADITTQNRNKSTCVSVDYFGRLLSIRDASILSGVPEKALYRRRQSGKTGDELFKVRRWANA